MGNVHLVEIMNQEDLGVKLENRIKNNQHFGKELLNLATSLPCPNTCIFKVFPPCYVGSVLLSTFVLRVC